MKFSASIKAHTVETRLLTWEEVYNILLKREATKQNKQHDLIKLCVGKCPCVLLPQRTLTKMLAVVIAR